MTEVELREIKERRAKARPGPWTVEKVGEFSVKAYAQDGILAVKVPEDWPDPEDFDPEQTEVFVPTGDDAVFVAAAYTDIPALVAEVEQLREGIKRMLYIQKLCDEEEAENDRS